MSRRAQSNAARRRAEKVAERRERRKARAALAEQTARTKPLFLPSEVLPDLLGAPSVRGDW